MLFPVFEILIAKSYSTFNIWIIFQGFSETFYDAQEVIILSSVLNQFPLYVFSILHIMLC